MGNFRSGGHNRTHGRYESAYRVDSYHLAGRIFKDGGMPYSWTRNGRPSGSIAIYYDKGHDCIVFAYDSDGTEGIRNHIDYELVPNNYGGSRMYFICPGCGRRSRFLCSHKKEFLCRKCAGLYYDIQQICKDDKAITYIDKILKALKVDINGMDNFEKARYMPYWKPKYMRQLKFDLLRNELIRHQESFWSSLARRARL